MDYVEAQKSLARVPHTASRTVKSVWDQAQRFAPQCWRISLQAVFPQGDVRTIRDTEPAAAARELPQSAAHETLWRALLDQSFVAKDDDSGRALGQIRRMTVLPMQSLLFSGYPAAVIFHQNPTQPPFTEEELRLPNAEADHRFEAADAGPRVFVLDEHGQPLGAAQAWSDIDAPLRAAITQRAAELLAKVSDAEPTLAHRERHVGEFATTAVVNYLVHRAHPALASSGGVTVALQPSVEEWMAVRESDFPPEDEFARFLPALKFIYDHAKLNPSLSQIAASVHLSPFHFHRKFTELIGLTPKHFLLECQIALAQSLLSGGDLELSAVAKQCGFAHQSHFTSRFKQATGATPSYWRKSFRRSR